MHDSLDQLRAHDIPATAQRLAVMDVVAGAPHATSEFILERVRERIGTISRQAVYNVLNLLSERGLLRRIQPAGSPARYEARVGDNHHHLVCRGCGRTVDVDCAVGHAPCLHAADNAGFKIDEAEVIYWGLCPECLKS
ncbi:MAG: Fur family transcriptional regulator [Luteolibacter sp.]